MSEENQTDTGVLTAGAESTPTPKAAAKTKKVGRPPTRKLAEMSVDERRKYEREGRADRRNKARAASSVKDRKYFSAVEIKKSDAFEILEKERLIRHPRVLDVLWHLAQDAARGLNIPLNAHLFIFGVQKTLEAIKRKKDVEQPQIEDVWYPGSRIRRHEEYALWDMGASWRTQPDGTSLSFERFLELRRVAMTDVFRFGVEVLGMDLHEKPHGQWARELFIQKNPDLLPEDYDWEDIKKAMDAQSPIKRRFLAAARSSYKSSFNIADLLSWTITFAGELRILCCSSTKPLSLGFLGKYRSYWQVKATPTLLNQIYPEFCIWPGDDAGTDKGFTSPMRRLDSIEESFVPVSLDTEGQAGSRCDYFVGEDIAEINNSSNPTQRAKTWEKFLMLQELVEPFGQLLCIGTPISSGSGDEDDPGDIYTALLARERASDEKNLLFQIHPAWTVKPGVNREPWDTHLIELEVDLLFPSRLTFKYLMAKLKENLVTDKKAKVFRQQSLCSWVPDQEEEISATFTRETLYAVIRPHNFFDSAQRIWRVLSLDASHTPNLNSDFSALVLFDILQVRDEKNGQAKNIAFVRDIRMEKLKTSDLAHSLINFITIHHPDRACSECSGDYISLQERIRDAARLRDVPLPQWLWAPVQNAGIGGNYKVIRCKATLEPLLAEGRLFFSSGIPVLNDLFDTLTKFDKPGPSRRPWRGATDFVDAISLGIQKFMPRQQPEERIDPDVAAFEEAARQQAQLRAMHEHIFGNPQQQPQQFYTPPPPDTPDSGGLTGTLGRYGLLRR